MKYFRSDCSIYHEDVHENMGVWCHVRAIGSIQSARDELVSINGVHFGPERIGDGNVPDRCCMR